MNKKLFWLLFSSILVFSFILRVVPSQDHNFFFTMDQADDGVWAREFFERGQLLWHGAQTNIPGVYSGPLWYYFISIGYLIFRGDPFGALFMVILLNVGLTGFIMYVLRKEVGETKALAVGFLLQFFWWFYDTSRWAFNPFPLVFCGVAVVLLLSLFLKTKKSRYFFLSTLPVFLGFNAEVAGASALFLFFVLFLSWAIWKRKIKLTKGLVGILILPSFGAAVLFFQLAKRFFANQESLLPGQTTGYFSGTNYFYIAQEFAQIFSYALLPYKILLSLGLFLLIFYFYYKQKNKNPFVLHFTLLSLGLFAVCFVMFGATRGWYDWHTVFLPTVLFTSVILLLLSIPKKFGIALLVVVMFFQISVFKERYREYLSPQKGPGVTSTQVKVLDWIYQNSENDGFNAYTYMPALRDYPYQYLFWWYGRKKYGFVPCEYSIYPGGLKLYVPNKDSYSTPTLGCERLRFLIIEAQLKADGVFSEWLRISQDKTILLDSVIIEGVKIEKRRLKRQEEL